MSLENILNDSRTIEAFREVVLSWHQDYRGSDADYAIYARGCLYSPSRQKLREIISRRIMGEVGYPSFVTAAEIESKALAHLVVSPTWFDNAYSVFVGDCVADGDCALWAQEFTVDGSGWQHTYNTLYTPDGSLDAYFFTPDMQKPNRSICLYIDRHVEVNLVFGYRYLPGRSAFYNIRCQITFAEYSKKAAQMFESDMKRFLRSMLRTLTLSGHLSEIPDHLESDEDGEYPEPTWQFAANLCQLQFKKITKQDTLSKRMRTAQEFLMHADDISHATVSTALCFAALESLLLPGKNSGNIADSLSRSIVNLLQPDSRERRRGREFVKKLYNARSRLVHGTSAIEDDSTRDDSRKLVSGVVVAILEWEKFQIRLGNDMPTANQLIDALKDADDGKEMMPDLNHLTSCLPS